MSLADGKIGSLKTLYLALKAFLDVYRIDVRFGEEFVWGNDVKLPCVVIAPLGGQWEQNGYWRSGDPQVGADPDQFNAWMTHEDIQLYCWSAAVDANGRELDTATAVDHADAVENLRAKVLQALQDQAPVGFMFRPTSGQWVWAGSETLRYGRAYVLTVNVDVSVPEIATVDATILTETINPSITEG
jgi:hypothetical protein